MKLNASASTSEAVTPKLAFETVIKSTAGAVVVAVICKFVSVSTPIKVSPEPLGKITNVSLVPVVMSVPPADCEKTSGVSASSSSTTSPVVPAPMFKSVASAEVMSRSNPDPNLMPFSVPPVPERVTSTALRISPEEVPPEVKAILRALFVGLVPSPVAKVKEMPSTPEVVVPRPESVIAKISTPGAAPIWVICTLESESVFIITSPAPVAGWKTMFPVVSVPKETPPEPASMSIPPEELVAAILMASLTASSAIKLIDELAISAMSSPASVDDDLICMPPALVWRTRAL